MVHRSGHFERKRLLFALVDWKAGRAELGSTDVLHHILEPQHHFRHGRTLAWIVLNHIIDQRAQKFEPVIAATTESVWVALQGT